MSMLLRSMAPTVEVRFTTTKTVETVDAEGNLILPGGLQVPETFTCMIP